MVCFRPYIDRVMSSLVTYTPDTEGLRAAVQRSFQEDPGSTKGKDRGLLFIFSWKKEHLEIFNSISDHRLLNTYKIHFIFRWWRSGGTITIHQVKKQIIK